MQHIANSVPVADFDKGISQFTGKGYSVVARYNTPTPEIVFFDTNKEIGVMDELMGSTKEGKVKFKR